jgi:hypothetical protein
VIEQAVDTKMMGVTATMQAEPVVKRKALANTYLYTYYRSFRTSKEEGDIGINVSKETQHAMLKVQSVIQSCIKRGYIEVRDDPQMIALSFDGKIFAEPRAVEIGILWTGALWLISVIGAANWGLIVRFISDR